MKGMLVSMAMGALCASQGVCGAPYRIAATIPLGAPDRWDYAVFDAQDGRLYVAHSDRLDVIDGVRGEVVGSVTGIPGGTHGTAIVHLAGEGLTDDGKSGTAVAFDLKTFKIMHSIRADQDADGMAFEPRSGHVFVIEGDPAKITVIDPKTNQAVATIEAGEKMEYPVAGDGMLYVAGEQNGDLLAIDTKANRIVSRWSAPGCSNPHGLALDARHKRLFMSCVNARMMVLDASNGRVVATLPIGRGSDAAAYDPSHGRVFSSNGADGTVSVFQQTDADHYRALEPVQTKVSGRTMAVDPRSGRLFVVAADTDPPAAPGGRPKPRPGTLAVLAYDPAP